MKSNGKVNWYRTVFLLTMCVALQSGATAEARGRASQRFTAASSSSATGQLRLALKNDAEGRLEIRVRDLPPNQSFDVLVGAVKVGTIVTDGGGQGRLRFRSRPRGHDLLLGFDPRGAMITIRDASGSDVLVGTIAAGGSVDATKVACCKPDDSGTECEDRTVEACTAEGGTPAAASSCLPNPCADVPPPVQDIICCVPDDSGAECEDRSAAECAARGGVVVAATSCTPNPCAATPPADPDIQCCLPDDSGTECEDRTPEQCAAQGGINMGPGSCTPNPCAATPAPGNESGDDHGGGESGHGRHGGGSDDRGGNRPYY